jgi:methyl-accepting chemotaxis protein
MLANIRSVTDTLQKNNTNVQNLSNASNVGHQGLQDVAASVGEIAKESEGLLEINSVMENIASQTNLLSMNAAIEAAHAGEAGKGFAVVADEIRKLAENSSEQSKTISNVLKQIKASIDKISSATNAVLGKFEAIAENVKTVAEQEENIRNAMEEQSAGSKQVLEAVSNLNSITQEVRSGAGEMAGSSSQVMEEAANLDAATQEIVNGMKDMIDGAHQVNTAVINVKGLTSQNQTTIMALVDEMVKFRVDDYAFNYDLIVAKHRGWIKNLRDYLDGQNINLKAGDHDHENCALGKWIYGEGKKFSESDNYKKLESIHHAFHSHAKAIIELKDAGNIAEAEQKYMALMEYYHQIVGFLDMLKEKK